jgi:hypothetical protein
MCFSTSPFRIALAAWVARYPPSFIERQPLRGFSIALVGVAVDIGESLSVPLRFGGVLNATYGKRALHPTPRTVGCCDGRQSSRSDH